MGLKEWFKSLSTFVKFIIIVGLIFIVGLIIYYVFIKETDETLTQPEKFNYSLDTQNNAIEKFVMSYIAMENGDLDTQTFYNSGEFQQNKALLSNLSNVQTV